MAPRDLQGPIKNKRNAKEFKRGFPKKESKKRGLEESQGFWEGGVFLVVFGIPWAVHLLRAAAASINYKIHFIMQYGLDSDPSRKRWRRQTLAVLLVARVRGGSAMGMAGAIVM